jgi:WD40 repeat protein
VSSVAFSPDGLTLVTAEGMRDGSWVGKPGAVKLWNAESGALQATLSGHSEPVTSVAFSPDGRYVVSGSHDRTVKLWDTAAGQLKLTLTGAPSAVLGVAFSGDGRSLAAGYADGSVDMWRIPAPYVNPTIGSP